MNLRLRVLSILHHSHFIRWKNGRPQTREEAPRDLLADREVLLHVSRVVPSPSHASSGDFPLGSVTNKLMYEPVRNRMHAHRTEPASNVRKRTRSSANRCFTLQKPFLRSRDALCIRLCVFTCARSFCTHTPVVHVQGLCTHLYPLWRLSFAKPPPTCVYGVQCDFYAFARCLFYAYKGH